MADEATYQQLVAAQAASRQHLTDMAVGYATASTAGFTAWYDNTAVAGWAAQVAGIVQAVQRQTAAVTDAYLTRLTSTMTGRPLTPSGTVDVTGLRKDTTPVQVYGRVAEQYRYAVSQGATPEKALGVATQRADVLADTDVALAARAQSQRFMIVHRVDGFRRVIHPELAKSGTCGLCVAASQNAYHRDQLLPLHARCVLPGTLVEGPSAEIGYRRRYEGEVVILRGASGQELAVTPNHPVLTTTGWKDAGLLNEGDEIFERSGADLASLDVPYEQELPTPIEQIWGALAVNGLRRMPVAPQDFHADGTDGYVEVVRTNRLLTQMINLEISETIAEPIRPGTCQSSVPNSLLSEGLPALHFLGGGRPTQSSVSLLDPCQPGFWTEPLIHDRRGLTASSNADSRFTEPARHHVTRNSVLAAERQHGGARKVVPGDLTRRLYATRRRVTPGLSRFDPPPIEDAAERLRVHADLGRRLSKRLAGGIKSSRLVQLRRIHYSGHVYNLQTAEGWFSAGGIIVSNCGCTTAPIINGVDPGHQLNRADLDSLYRRAGGTQAPALSKVRYTVHDNGELGPVLAPHGAPFRGPTEVAAA